MLLRFLDIVKQEMHYQDMLIMRIKNNYLLIIPASTKRGRRHQIPASTKRGRRHQVHGKDYDRTYRFHYNEPKVDDNRYNINLEEMDEKIKEVARRYLDDGYGSINLCKYISKRKLSL